MSSLSDVVKRATLKASQYSLPLHTRFGENGKKFHFFMSHKKTHARDGNAPSVVAQGVVDSIASFGFHGFFDADHLLEITEEGIRIGIEESCCMIVLLNDETMSSKWCRREWRLATELQMPIKVVCDIERCRKQDLVLQAGSEFPNMLHFQWVDYTTSRRREAYSELVSFIADSTGERGGDDAPSSQGDSVDPKADGFARPRRSDLWHPHMNWLMLAGGFTIFALRDMLPAATRGRGFVPADGRIAQGVEAATDEAARLDETVAGEDSNKHAPPSHCMEAAAIGWMGLVRCFRYVCMLMCLWRLLYAHGPAFTDGASAATTLTLHAHLLFAPTVLGRLFTSPIIRAILVQAARSGTSHEELAASMYQSSTVLVRLGLAVCLPAIAIYLVAWEPLFLSHAYTGASASALESLFGRSSALLFGLGIATLIPLFVSSTILTALLRLIAVIPLRASFDVLSPQLAAVGLCGFLTQQATQRRKALLQGRSVVARATAEIKPHESHGKYGERHLQQPVRPSLGRSCSLEAGATTSIAGDLCGDVRRARTVASRHQVAATDASIQTFQEEWLAAVEVNESITQQMSV